MIKNLFQVLGLLMTITLFTQCSHPEKAKTRTAVTDALATKKDKFQSCGEKVKEQTGKAPNGKVILGWDIDKTGAAQNIVVVENSTENDDLASCLKATILQTEFPTSAIVKEYKVQFPFVYKN